MLTVSDNHIVLGGGGGGGSTTFEGLSDKATADIPAINTPLATALNTKEDTSNKKTGVDANKTSDTFFPSIKAVFDWVSGLFVKGAASSADNAIARFDGATGRQLQNSAVTIDDAGNMTVGTGAGFGGALNLTTTSSSVTTLIGLSHTPKAAWGINIGDESTPSLYFGLSEAYTPGQAKTKYFWRANWDDATTASNTFKVASLNTDVVTANIQGVSGQTATLLACTSDGGQLGDVFTVRPNGVGISAASPTALLDVNGTCRLRGNATFNGQIIDNVGSSGVDGQVLKKVGGLVVWANP